MTTGDQPHGRVRSSAPAGPRLSEPRMRQALVGLAGVQLATGVWLAAAPGSFVDTIAPFGDAEDHFLRDIATVYLALTAALLMSARRPSWRVPVLFFATLQYAIHSINHLIDIGGTDPAWLGYFNFVALASLTAALGYLLAAAAQGER